MSVSKNKGILSHDENRKIVSRITKTKKKHHFSVLISLLQMSTFTNSACSLVSILALLLVVLCRMFSHHVSIEARRCGALVVAVSTGKRLFTSVRLYVSFQVVRQNTKIVTLTTPKRQNSHIKFKNYKKYKLHQFTLLIFLL